MPAIYTVDPSHFPFFVSDPQSFTMATQWFTGGALPPPPGIEPNFVDPPSQLHGNIALHTVFLSVATLAVAMRLFTRLYMLRTRLGIDDCKPPQ